MRESSGKKEKDQWLNQGGNHRERGGKGGGRTTTKKLSVFTPERETGFEREKRHLNREVARDVSRKKNVTLTGKRGGEKARGLPFRTAA